MINTLNFLIEKGEPIVGKSHFSARIKLADESKNLLREKLGSTIQFDNLDGYFNLNSENFYVYYNKCSGHNGKSELHVRNGRGGHFAFEHPFNYYGFSIELSSDGSIADYGFYPLYTIYNPNHYDKAKEKVFVDYGELLPTVSDVLGKLLSNANSLTTQDIFLQIRSEIAEKEAKLASEKRQAEEALNKKNAELKELIEKDEIKIFKVIKGHDIGNGRSAVILQFDGKGDKIVLDSNKYYIAEYQHRAGWEGDEYLHFVGPRDEMLVGYENLFFVLNQSSYDLKSGFYSIYENANSYAEYLNGKPSFSDDRLSEELSDRTKGNDNQVMVESTVNKSFSKLVYSEKF